MSERIHENSACQQCVRGSGAETHCLTDDIHIKEANNFQKQNGSLLIQDIPKSSGCDGATAASAASAAAAAVSVAMIVDAFTAGVNLVDGITQWSQPAS